MQSYSCSGRDKENGLEAAMVGAGGGGTRAWDLGVKKNTFSPSMPIVLMDFGEKAATTSQEFQGMLCPQRKTRVGLEQKVIKMLLVTDYESQRTEHLGFRN